jgi:hypothetical protein
MTSMSNHLNTLSSPSSNPSPLPYSVHATGTTNKMSSRDEKSPSSGEHSKTPPASTSTEKTRPSDQHTHPPPGASAGPSWYWGWPPHHYWGPHHPFPHPSDNGPPNGPPDQHGMPPWWAIGPHNMPPYGYGPCPPNFSCWRPGLGCGLAHHGPHYCGGHH